jgi:hypothetical protein
VLVSKPPIQLKRTTSAEFPVLLRFFLFHHLHAISLQKTASSNYLPSDHQLNEPASRNRPDYIARDSNQTNAPTYIFDQVLIDRSAALHDPYQSFATRSRPSPRLGISHLSFKKQISQAITVESNSNGANE